MKPLIKFTVSVVLIGLIIWYLGGVTAIFDVISQASPVYLLVAFLVMSTDRALMVFKWTLLLKNKNLHLPFFQGMKIYCSSNIWGIFLPSTIGADAIRAYITTKLGLDAHQTVASIIVERMVGFIASLLVGLIGFLILSITLDLDDKFDPIWYAGGAVLATGIALFSLSLSTRFFDSASKYLPAGWRKTIFMSRLKRLHEIYISYCTDKLSISLFFVLTLAEQFVAILFAWTIALSLSVDTGLLFITAVIPVSILIARLPISFDGIGIFEGVFVLLMSLGGVGAAEAISIALIGRIIQILSFMPWWLAYTINSGSIKPPSLGHTRI